MGQLGEVSKAWSKVRARQGRPEWSTSNRHNTLGQRYKAESDGIHSIHCPSWFGIYHFWRRAFFLVQNRDGCANGVKPENRHHFLIRAPFRTEVHKVWPQGIEAGSHNLGRP